MERRVTTAAAKHIKVRIDETGRNCLKDKPQIFNQKERLCSSTEEVKQFLIDHYGKIPNGRKKVYQDSKDEKTKVIGFLHSYWNRDVSHNSKPWYQTDWITFSLLDTKPWDFVQIFRRRERKMSKIGLSFQDNFVEDVIKELGGTLVGTGCGSTEYEIDTCLSPDALFDFLSNKFRKEIRLFELEEMSEEDEDGM